MKAWSLTTILLLAILVIPSSAEDFTVTLVDDKGKPYTKAAEMKYLPSATMEKRSKAMSFMSDFFKKDRLKEKSPFKFKPRDGHVIRLRTNDGMVWKETKESDGNVEIKISTPGTLVVKNKSKKGRMFEKFQLSLIRDGYKWRVTDVPVGEVSKVEKIQPGKYTVVAKCIGTRYGTWVKRGVTIKSGSKATVEIPILMKKQGGIGLLVKDSKTGKVLDSKSGVRLSLLLKDQHIALSTTSGSWDSKGKRYHGILGVSPGSYRIRVTAKGYETKIVKVSLSPGKAKGKDMFGNVDYVYKHQTVKLEPK